MRPMRQRQRRSLRVAASNSMATRAEADNCTLGFLLLISATCASSCKAKLLMHLTLANRALTRCHQDATEA